MEEKSNYVTFRELIEREDRLLLRVEGLLSKHFGLFEKDINTRFVGYGHEVAEQLQQMRKSIIHELRAPDGGEPASANIQGEIKTALRGGRGAGPFVLAAAIVVLALAILSWNPQARHLLPFL